MNPQASPPPADPDVLNILSGVKTAAQLNALLVMGLLHANRGELRIQKDDLLKGLASALAKDALAKCVWSQVEQDTLVVRLTEECALPTYAANVRRIS